MSITTLMPLTDYTYLLVSKNNPSHCIVHTKNQTYVLSNKSLII